MCHSTVEYSHDERVLSLPIRNGEAIIATLKITGGRLSGSEDRTSILETEDCEVEDTETPILICRSGSPPRSNILLLEETDYGLKIDLEPGIRIDEAFSYLQGNNADMTLKSFEFSAGDTFLLRFDSFVGKGNFDLTLNGIRHEVPFEVRSRKIGYRTQYPRMLSDIAEFSTSLLLSIRSPLYSHYSISGSGFESKYEEFLILEYVFDHLDFIGAYETIRQSKHREIVNGVENVPACVAHSIDPSGYDMLVLGDNLDECEGGIIRGQYNPRWIAEPITFDTFDTPENRLVKEAVLSVLSMSGRLLRDLSRSCSDYMRERLEWIHTESSRMSSDEWLADIGDLSGIPFDSMVLHHRPGYSELFSAYQILGLGALFDQSDAQRVLKGHGSKVHLVYEYWCYIQLHKCLKSKTTSWQEIPISTRDGGWEVTIRNRSPVTFSIPCNGQELEVDLYYNRTFYNNDDDLSSYSVNLRPDFTLVVRSSESPKRGYLVNFDSKYKAKPIDSRSSVVEESQLVKGCWEYDIYKMHTYRDALLHSFGSYVLFPGDRNEMYPKRVRDHGKILPSVGAVCLTPGCDTGKLSMVLDCIFEDIVSFSIGEKHPTDLL